jgi:1,4-alpha-glucan branching enzyme
LSPAKRRQPVDGENARDAVVPSDLLTDDDLYLFNEGSHFKLYQKLGAHPGELEGRTGVYFAVWAPDAERVSVLGAFNGWTPGAHPLSVKGDSGIWTGFIPELDPGTVYKYKIESRYGGYKVEKADPFAFHTEVPPKTASVVWDLTYEWGDADWMSARAETNALEAPMSIYEMHIGSWRRVPEEGNRSLSYRELAAELVPYLTQLGYTHVEFMPVMEHPFSGSWGYQVTGYFAPTSRFGTPQDFMYLVDQLHRAGIGVILDWVPSHFPSDEHGLAYFDGTHLYEHADARKGFHPDWQSYIFNYGRNEVRSFLISSAQFWADVYHADGLRVDAVASMLYLDYSRKVGEWIPNQYGGNENLEAIDMLRRMNEVVYQGHPGVQTIAEESTAWPMVSRPTYVGGLGFGMKWDMGWMHDTLDYIQHDPVHRKYHHNQLSFRLIYAFNENFVLSLSHDEVVHGKGSLADKMPGDAWQKLANVRALLGYMYGQPGKKLLFMGGELGQWAEWNHDTSLDWHLLDEPPHAGLQRWVADLNQVYRDQPALYQVDFDPAGFEWVDANDWEGSIVSFIRHDRARQGSILVVTNFTPVVRKSYRVGVPDRGVWAELLNSDAEAYGGSGVGNLGEVHARPIPSHGRPYSLSLTVPPLGVLFLRNRNGHTAESSANVR